MKHVMLQDLFRFAEDGDIQGMLKCLKKGAKVSCQFQNYNGSSLVSNLKFPSHPHVQQIAFVCTYVHNHRCKKKIRNPRSQESWHMNDFNMCNSFETFLKCKETATHSSSKSSCEVVIEFHKPTATLTHPANLESADLPN